MVEVQANNTPIDPIVRVPATIMPAEQGQDTHNIRLSECSSDNCCPQGWHQTATAPFGFPEKKHGVTSNIPVV